MQTLSTIAEWVLLVFDEVKHIVRKWLEKKKRNITSW